MRVLVVEDDSVARRQIEAALAGGEFEVVPMENGATALKRLQSPGAPRLVLVDWEMPELDGPSLLRKLRADANRPFTYVLMVTIRDRREDIVGGLEAGADDYVVKPIDTAELRARVRAGARIVQKVLALEQRIEDLQRRAA